jgi:transposase
MSTKKWIVELTQEERTGLLNIVKKGKSAAYKTLHANILLKADQGPGGENWTDVEIADAFNCQYNTAFNVRKRFVEEGFERALGRNNRKNYQRKLNGEQEAKLTVLACSDPPEGYSRWTMVLLADKMVELGIVESISPVTIHRTLKKTNLSLGR